MSHVCSGLVLISILFCHHQSVHASWNVLSHLNKFFSILNHLWRVLLTIALSPSMANIFFAVFPNFFLSSNDKNASFYSIWNSQYTHELYWKTCCNVTFQKMYIYVINFSTPSILWKKNSMFKSHLWKNTTYNFQPSTCETLVYSYIL